MPLRQACLALGAYGVSQAQILAMTEAELMSWLQALAALKRPQRRAHGRSGEVTTHVQSLRRRKPQG